MAGAGKRSPHSILRRPLVGPGLIYARAKLALVPFRPATARRLATAKSVIRKPAAIGPGLIYPAAKLALAVRRQQWTGQKPRTFLGKPAVVNPAVTFPAAKVKLATRRHIWERARYTLGTPIVSPPTTFPPAATTLAKRRHIWERAAHTSLPPPTVVNSAVTFPPAALRLVRWDRRRQWPHSQRGVPTVSAAVFQPAQAATRLAKRTRVPGGSWSALRPQSDLTVGTPPPVFTPSRPAVVLARRLTRPQHATYSLRPPVVIGPAAVIAAAQVRLSTRPRRPGGSWSALRPQPDLTQGTVQPPAGFTPAQATIYLARKARQLWLPVGGIRAPAEIAPPIVPAPAVVHLAVRGRQRQMPLPAVRPPLAVATPTTFAAAKLYLARRATRFRRQAIYTLGNPIVSPFVPPPPSTGPYRTLMGVGI